MLAVMLLSVVWSGGRAEAQGPTFALSPQNQTVDLAAGHVSVEVQIAGATSVAAFQFRLRYDPGVLSHPTVQVGSFLGSTGLTPQCPDPLVDVDGPRSDPGTVLYGCATIGQNAGVNGSGTLATVTFDLAGGASTNIYFEHLSATDTLANNFCDGGKCGAQSGSVTVSGGDPTKDQGYANTPTAVPVVPDDTATPTSVSGSGHRTPTEVSASPASGSAGSGGTGVTGAGGTAAGGGGSTSAPSGTVAGVASGSSGGGTGVGKFGYGPQPENNHGARLAAVLALVVGVVGGVALAYGERLRRRVLASR